MEPLLHPVAQELLDKSELFQLKNKEYGNTYEILGHALFAILPEVTLKSVSDYNRFATFLHIFGKVIRYAVNFDKGGHEDSLDDIAVYAMILKKLDTIERECKASGAPF